LIKKLFYFLQETLKDAWSFVRSPVEGIKRLYRASLYRNAAYLILSAVALGLTGFFYWIAAARLYPDDEVGLASAAVSAMTLLSLLSLVGLDYALIRFIPGSGERSRDVMNSSLTIGTAVAIVLALVFIAGLSWWSPGLHTLVEHPALLATFVLSVAATTIFTLLQRIFAAKLRSSYALVIGLVFGLLRFVPLVIVAASSMALGIFNAWVIALCVAMAAGFLLLPRVEPGYRPSLTLKRELVSPMLRFAFANYLANVSMTITGSVLPLLVLYVLGKEQTAYFYIAWTYSTVVVAVLSGVTISLFAEGSHDRERLKEYIKKSLKLMALILVPVVALTMVLGGRILLVFGEGYSANATDLLWLLALAAIPIGINATYIAVMRVFGQTTGIVVVTLVSAFVTLGLSPYLLSRFGLTGVGLAWLASQTLVALFAGWQILKIYTRP
jgi:O-antigen/teichoic acid export membrane protein